MRFITSSLAMPRRYTYRRKYSYKPRKKWNSNWNSDDMNLNIPDISTTSAYTKAITNTQLIINPIDETTRASTCIVKVKNVKVQLCTSGIPDPSSLSVYTMQVAIVFCPEGITPSSDILERHPEWLMAYKMLTIDASTTIPINFSISSRLARNLNSGDTIYLTVIARRVSGETVTQPQTGLIMPCYYTVQYWTV